MPQFYPWLFASEDQDLSRNNAGFWHDHEISVFGHSSGKSDQTLNTLVYKIRKNPKNLLTHLRRIYFCQQADLPEQLYAALLDLFIVLQGKGFALRRRMLFGSRSHLEDQQFQRLAHAIKRDFDNLGNRFSLFTTGRIGIIELVEHQKAETKHDFLMLANDFIEYSQLDQAMDVLETGISLHPDRFELQEALLELYKSTDSANRFQSSYTTFLAHDITLIDDWQSMAYYFEGKSR